MKPNQLVRKLAAVAVLCSLSAAAQAAEAPVKATKPKPVDTTIQGEEKAVLTQAPFVPPPIKPKRS